MGVASVELMETLGGGDPMKTFAGVFVAQHPAPVDRSHRQSPKIDQWQHEWIVKKYFDPAK